MIIRLTEVVTADQVEPGQFLVIEGAAGPHRVDEVMTISSALLDERKTVEISHRPYTREGGRRQVLRLPARANVERHIVGVDPSPIAAVIAEQSGRPVIITQQFPDPHADAATARGEVEAETGNLTLAPGEATPVPGKAAS